MKTKKTTVYLAGPMGGIPDFNFPAFHEAAKALRKYGYTVINPAELDEEDGIKPKKDGAVTGQERAWFLKRDLARVITVDGVVFLPGFERSKGAQIELVVALACGIRVGDYNPVTSGVVDDDGNQSWAIDFDFDPVTWRTIRPRYDLLDQHFIDLHWSAA